MATLRPPAVPLVNVDPYFNIWSCADRLYDDVPRHWSGKRNAMTGLLKIDGVWKRFMGKVQIDSTYYYTEPDPLQQTDVTVLPTTTNYTFACDEVRLHLQFMTPLLLDDLACMSRPITYISYEITSNDGKPHAVEFFFDISAECCIEDGSQQVALGETPFGLYCGRGDKDVLAKSGDDIRIDWGYLHLLTNGHQPLMLDFRNKNEYLFGNPYQTMAGETKIDGVFPALCCCKTYTVTPESPATSFVCVGYDDLFSIEYFGKPIQAYWKKDGQTFADIARLALEEYPTLIRRTAAFDRDLTERASKTSRQYADILSLAYRQVIAAHKLTWDDGELQFFSKECYSNGCIATVDITYPSIPLFLLYNPTLIYGMLNPIFKYAATQDWAYPFAPHDAGQYPLANGQVYGYDAKTRVMAYDMQMPVEESGNVLLCVAAVCRTTGDYSYAQAHFDQLQQWADYLAENGWDPQNQLCTDDFAGHLAHNCNLSIKAALAIAAWGQILTHLQQPEAAGRYRQIAEEMAGHWKAQALDNDHYALAFHSTGTWSIKYNLVWDTLLDLHVFDPAIAKTEVAFYSQKINRYGLPLDSRSDYTKSDWQMWSTMLTNDTNYTNAIIGSMWQMLNETRDRVPFSDWYYTSKPYMVGFQNRAVQGGLFIRLLAEN